MLNLKTSKKPIDILGGQIVDLGPISPSCHTRKLETIKMPLVLGGWSPAGITPEARAALERALIGSSLTVTKVLSVRLQVVPVARTTKLLAQFLAQVFNQPWTNTTELKFIVAVPSANVK